MRCCRHLPDDWLNDRNTGRWKRRHFYIQVIALRPISDGNLSFARTNRKRHLTNSPHQVMQSNDDLCYNVRWCRTLTTACSFVVVLFMRPTIIMSNRQPDEKFDTRSALPCILYRDRIVRKWRITRVTGLCGLTRCCHSLRRMDAKMGVIEDRFWRW
jgi:hypothetical protein